MAVTQRQLEATRNLERYQRVVWTEKKLAVYFGAISVGLCIGFLVSGMLMALMGWAPYRFTDALLVLLCAGCWYLARRLYGMTKLSLVIIDQMVLAYAPEHRALELVRFHEKNST